MNRTVTTALLAALITLPATAAEELPTEQLPDVEITVQRYRQPKESATSAVTVLSRDDLAASGGETVRDALVGLPGVDLRPTGAAGGVTGLSIRGSRAEQVLILIDGRRVNNAQGGGVDLVDLPLVGVERIEILRGSGSALYGTDPIGGVVNIVTRQGGSEQLDARLTLGSFDSHAMELGYGAFGSRGSYRTDFQWHSQAGDFPYRDNLGVTQHRDNNKLLRTTGRFSGELDLDGWGQWRGGLGYTHAVKGVPGRLGFPLADARQRDFRYDAWLSPSWELGRGGELVATFYGQGEERDYEDRTGAFPVNSNHRNYTVAGELLATVETAGRGRAVVGLDTRREDIDSTDDGRRHRLTGGVFGLYEVPLGPVLLIPSARVDWQTGQKAIFTPKFGLTATATPRLGFRANVGTAFRAPSFDDLFWPEDPFARGNPLLRPEHSTEWDLGATWRPVGDLTLDFGYFNRDASDLITWLPGLGNKWQPQNIGRVRFQGVEASLSTSLPMVPGLSLSGNYTWLDATVHSGSAAEIGRQLVGQPEHYGATRLRYQRGRWLADLHYRVVGDRYTTAANTQWLGGYTAADALVRFCPTARDEWTVELRNLFDADYRTVLDFPVPGFELRVSASRTF